MGTKTQWVNYPSSDATIGAFKVRRADLTDGDVSSINDMGRVVYLKVKFEKQNFFAMAKLTLKRHGSNAFYTPTERSKNAGVFVPTRDDVSFVSLTGEAVFRVRLTPAGGDRYKFEAVNLASGKKVESADEIQTRRKLFYQIVCMSKASMIGGGQKSKLKERFWDPSKNLYLKLEEYASGKTIPNLGNFNDEHMATKEMVKKQTKKVYDKSKAPYAFVVLFVNKNCIPGQEDSWRPAAVSGNSTNVNTYARLFSYADPSIDDFKILEWVPDSTGVAEPFGKADVTRTGPRTLKVNTTGKTRGAGYFQWSMLVVSIEGMGLSLSNENLVTIASRDCDGKKVDKKTQLNILVHEIGHKIGMVPGPQGDPDLDRQTTYYDGRGHSGGHCRHPAPLLPTYQGVSPSPKPTCTMFGDIRTKTDQFCPNCLTSVRKLDVDPARKVGLKNQF